MRFNRFVKHSRAPETIIGFIKDFSDDADAIERIDDFVEKAIKLGISKKPKGSDKAGAAQLASLILTSLYPNKFVDFRKNRWVRLAINLKYPFPDSNVTYGDWLIWAGRFANAIVRTQTYKEFWPKNKFPYFEPLWVVAGICWKEPKFHKQSSLALDTDLDWYLEGNRKKRAHLALERNRAVIRKAKDAAFKREPFLRCQICGFSFKEIYGDRGDRFIEAHHKQPLGQLGAKTRTRIEDIALVCSNCHRMLHRGERTLTIEELREITK